MGAVEKTSAIVFLPREGDAPSVMLEPILFDPAALWLCESLKRAGVERFLVVCHHKDPERAAACFPEDTAILTEGKGLEDEFHLFLETPGRVIVVTEPVFLTDRGVERIRQGKAELDEQELAGYEARGDDPGASHCVYELTAAAKEALLAGEPLVSAVRSKGAGYRGHVAVEVTAESLDTYLPRVAQTQSVLRCTDAGARFIDRQSAYIGPRVTVERGTLVLPNVILRGGTTIGRNCQIGPNTMLLDVSVGEGSTVNASQASESAIGAFTTVGPFAYLRPGNTVGDHVRVGDFVELKNAAIGHETKISHLAYLGDCDVGEGSDIGCGTVTVNFDGARKFRTRIGDGAFVGCNTNLVAPVSVGDRAYIAAGSTITRDVPSDSLAIARSQQTVKHNWAKKRRAKQEKEKK